MVTTVKVSTTTFVQSGIEMTSVIGTFGNGKRPVGRIVMGTYPTGTVAWYAVLAQWMKANPDIKVAF
jgi:hypothetical protein